MTIEEWHYINTVKPKQDWQRVSQQAKDTKLRNKKSKRDLERELRIKDLGGKTIEVVQGVPLSEEARKLRITVELDLKYPKRKEKKVRPKRKACCKSLGKDRTEGEFFSGVLKTAKVRALAKGLPFDLDAEHFKLPKVCPVLGLPLYWSSKVTDNTPSIDRMIPEKGYIKGNCFIISMKANRLKNNATIPELEAILEYMKGVTGDTAGL